MKSIQILDCTLRDGGYINNWRFGQESIKAIIEKLTLSNIDIIECGFLSDAEESMNCSLFPNVAMLDNLLQSIHKKASMYVAMIAIGEKELNPEKLDDATPYGLNGIRLSFHKDEIEKAIEWARIIKNKGYELFVQPIGTISYSTKELLYLIDSMNQIEPYAFYIVDTLGNMTTNSVKDFFRICDEKLNRSICIGFHSHNNLQLAFSNSEKMINLSSQRNIIIDASVCGMGRGAGNLPSELITDYLNKEFAYEYDVVQILDVFDRYIYPFYNKNEWGYSIPYCIAAQNMCHPNYASFLINKQTLRMIDIHKIIASIPMNQRIEYNKKAIENLYISYQSSNIEGSFCKDKFVEMLEGRKILLLAPGKSLISEQDRINDYIERNKPIVISINFLNDLFSLDFCFVSNRKRAEDIIKFASLFEKTQIIYTSNINLSLKNVCHKIDYQELLIDDEILFDNAGLMLINLLKRCGIRDLVMAGFDGYDYQSSENYFDATFSGNTDAGRIIDMQHRFCNIIRKYKQEMNIIF